MKIFLSRSLSFLLSLLSISHVHGIVDQPAGNESFDHSLKFVPAGGTKRRRITTAADAANTEERHRVAVPITDDEGRLVDHFNDDDSCSDTEPVVATDTPPTLQLQLRLRGYRKVLVLLTKQCTVALKQCEGQLDKMLEDKLTPKGKRSPTSTDLRRAVEDAANASELEALLKKMEDLQDLLRQAERYQQILAGSSRIDPVTALAQVAAFLEEVNSVADGVLASVEQPSWQYTFWVRIKAACTTGVRIVRSPYALGVCLIGAAFVAGKSFIATT